MPLIIVWVLIYSVVVAASILLIGKPDSILGNLNIVSLLKLLLDWRFLLGGMLALAARFIFVIINNLASKHESLSSAHLTVTAMATIVSILFVIVANYFLLGEQLRITQVIGAVLILTGVFFVFR